MIQSTFFPNLRNLLQTTAWQMIGHTLSPLRISRPKLIWIGEKCIIDWKFPGVLIPNNGSEF